MRQPRREPGGQFLVAALPEDRERLAGETLHQVNLIVLEVDEEGRGGVALQVGEGELADELARGPGVDDVGGPAVREHGLDLPQAFKRGGREQRLRDHVEGRGIFRDGDHAGVTQPGELVRKRPDVVEAVAGEVAVVDEKDVHAGPGGG